MAVTTSPAPAAPTSQEALNVLLRDLLPSQSDWSDDAYLWLTNHTNRLIRVGVRDRKIWAPLRMS